MYDLERRASTVAVVDLELDLDDETIAELERIATADETSSEDVARRAIRDYLARTHR